MAVYYLMAGMIANVALISNIIILLGVMCSFGTTLTLPGIAGIVLTIGMAVDANVLIFERIREELSKGKSLRGALSAGYSRAFGTIFDSHVTTLISSVILIFMEFSSEPAPWVGLARKPATCATHWIWLHSARLQTWHRSRARTGFWLPQVCHDSPRRGGRESAHLSK